MEIALIERVDSRNCVFPLEAFNQSVVFSILVIPSMFGKYVQTEAFKSYHDQRCSIITPDVAKQLNVIPEGSNVLLHILHHGVEFESVITHLQRLCVESKNQAKCYALVFKSSKDLHPSFSDARTVMQCAPQTPIVLIPNGTIIRLWKRTLVYELFEQKVLLYSGRARTLVFHVLAQNCKALALLDTGASHSFVSLRFIETNRINFQKVVDSATVADGQSMPLHGKTKIHMMFGSFQNNASVYVAALNPAYDIILGMDWLDKHHAVLDCRAGTCSLLKGKAKVTLRQTPSVFSIRKSPHKAVSATQLFRMARKGCKLIVINFTQYSQEKDLADEVDEDKEWGTEVEIPRDVNPLLRPILQKYRDVFPNDLPHYLPPRREVGHTIPLEEGAKPVFRPIYRLSPAERDEVQRQVTDLLERGWINPSKSPYGSPILFVQKKDGSLRMCVDYRALNKQTVKNRYAMPRIDDLMDQLRGSIFFTKIDLAQGYHQIRISESDTEKTAFRTPIGHFEYRVLPFGLTNAPATFQSVMNDIYSDLLIKYVKVYIDDILVHSKTPEEHVKHVAEVLQRLRVNKLFAKMKKCEFMTNTLTYLGLSVSPEGLRPDPEKVEAIKDWATPTDVHEVRSFLGFGNYFRRFIQGYSNLVVPLVALTKKDAKFDWTPQCEEAFQGVIWNLINAPTLILPDPSRPYQVVSDASGFGLGAVLLQEDKPIAFESRKMSSAERKLLCFRTGTLRSRTCSSDMAMLPRGLCRVNCGHRSQTKHLLGVPNGPITASSSLVRILIPVFLRFGLSSWEDEHGRPVI